MVWELPGLPIQPVSDDVAFQWFGFAGHRKNMKDRAQRRNESIKKRKAQKAAEELAKEAGRAEASPATKEEPRRGQGITAGCEVAGVGDQDRGGTGEIGAAHGEGENGAGVTGGAAGSAPVEGGAMGSAPVEGGATGSAPVEGGATGSAPVDGGAVAMVVE